jgi:hypothetical protein
MEFGKARADELTSNLMRSALAQGKSAISAK